MRVRFAVHDGGDHKGHEQRAGNADDLAPDGLAFEDAHAVRAILSAGARGSGTPASLKPLARRTQLSHVPHGRPSGAGS